MESVLDKFLRYVSYDTQSDEASDTQPSAAGQLVLLRLLADELKALGVADAAMDEYGYVTGTIPSNIDRATPVVGFLAHVDTSPDLSGANVKPQIVGNYGGGDLVLNREKNLVLRVADYPEIETYCGQTLISADGTTLLGADDKAGVAEIMYFVQTLQTHPEIEHGVVKIGFTPDEEIGRGVNKFDVAKFGADYAYTFDGGALGELEYENFNAAEARIDIQGNNIHPGYAKNRMINAALVGMELNAMLPVEQRPEFTSGYEGFFHLTEITGTVEKAEMRYLIREHDSAKFEQKKEWIKSCVDLLNRRYGNIITLEINEQYRNMREKIEPQIQIVDLARRAMEQAGVVPLVKPIRGGTDGARLSFMGLPCPNIFAGGHNFHSKYEFIPVESMEKACETMLNIAKLFAEPFAH